MIMRYKYCAVLFLLLSFAGIAGLSIANEFVKKKPVPRIARKEAQQKEVSLERCASLSDDLLLGILKIQERLGNLGLRLYSVLRQLALGEACSFECASLEQLKKIEVSLELLDKELQSLESCMQQNTSVLDT